MIRSLRFITIVVATHLFCLLSLAQLEPSLLERATTGDATAMHLIGRATAAAGKPVEGYAWFSLAAEYGVETAEKSALLNTLSPAQVTEAARRAEEIRSTQLRGLPPPAKVPAARVVEEKRPVVERPVATPQVAPPSIAQHSLDGQVEAQKARIARLEADLVAARAETSAANAKSDEKTTQLDAALAKASQERDELAAEISNLRRNTQRAEDLLAQMRAQPSLDVQVETQRAQLAKLEADLAAARSESSAANARSYEKTTQLEAALAKAGQEKETLSAEIVSLRQDRLRAEEARDAMRAEVSAVRSKLETDLAAAQAEARVAKQKAGEANKLETTLAQTTQERDALAAEIATLRREKLRAEESLAQLSARPSLEGKVQEQQAQIAKLETGLSAAQSETRAAREESSKARADLQAALAKTGQENEKLVTEISALRRDKQRAEEALAQLQSRPSLNGEVEAQKAQIAKLEADLTAARAETSAAKEKAGELDTQLQTALANPNPDRDAHSREIATLRQDRLRAEQARDQLRVDFAAARSKLEADLAAARNETREVRAQVAKLEADLAAARSEARSGEAQLGESTAQLQDALAKASDDLTAEQIRNENLVRELARVRPGVLLASADTSTPRAAPSRTPASEFVVVPVPAATAVRVHTVANGENLSMISLRYYNSPNRWQEIFNANREVMNSPNQLAPGTKLRIP
jgi:chromosome segregation ATPase